MAWMAAYFVGSVIFFILLEDLNIWLRLAGFLFCLALYWGAEKYFMLLKIARRGGLDSSRSIIELQQYQVAVESGFFKPDMLGFRLGFSLRGFALCVAIYVFNMAISPSFYLLGGAIFGAMAGSAWIVSGIFDGQ